MPPQLLFNESSPVQSWFELMRVAEKSRKVNARLPMHGHELNATELQTEQMVMSWTPQSFKRSKCVLRISKLRLKSCMTRELFAYLCQTDVETFHSSAQIAAFENDKNLFKSPDGQKCNDRLLSAVQILQLQSLGATQRQSAMKVFLFCKARLKTPLVSSARETWAKWLTSRQASRSRQSLTRRLKWKSRATSAEIQPSASST